MSRRDDELDEEIAAHLELAIRERMARGESRVAAERAVRGEFGNITHIKEVTREVRGGALWLERLAQDVRYGARALGRTPGFTVVAALTLALAVGANSAVFTVVNGVLLRPLPFRDPGRLYLVSWHPTALPFEIPPGLSDREWLDYRERAGRFQSVAGYQRSQVTLSGAGDAARLRGARVSAAFFDMLGVPPAIGRPFARDEEQPGPDGVVILGDRVWRERFGADSSVIGRSVTLDNVSHTVVGVMPAGFGFPARSDIWTPLAIRLDPGNSFQVTVLGRLRDGVTPEQARSELGSIMRSRLGEADAADASDHVPRVIPLKQNLTAPVERALLIFAGAVGFVLLIACANVANLLLIRAATRRHEIAVRVALGAGRGRIARQLLTESLLVAAAGGGAGILLGVAGVRALLALAPSDRIPRLDQVHVDFWVLAFTLAISLVAGLAFGVLPALSGSRRAPREGLGQSFRTVGSPQGHLRAVLVAAEIALALVLLTGAGLMIKSFVRMRSLDTGYDAARVVTMTVDLPRTAYPDAIRIRGFYEGLRRRLAQIPGVTSVGAASFPPMRGMGIMGDLVVEGNSALPPGYLVDKPTASPGYFSAMGIRLMRGRDFTALDQEGAPGVVIVSQSVAQALWPDGDAVGRRISMASSPTAEDWLTVIGVVDDVVQDGALSRHSTIYLPYLQVGSLFFLDHMTFVVRSPLSARAVGPAMRAALRDVDPTVPAQAVQTVDEAMRITLAEPIFQMRLLVVFSVIALLLAAVGIYGVLAYDVAERTREIGLRIALGATPGDILRWVLRRTVALSLVGTAVGVLGALALTGVLRKWLFEVTPTDPATLIAVALGFTLVALGAGYIPGRRATRIQVLGALQRE